MEIKWFILSCENCKIISCEANLVKILLAYVPLRATVESNDHGNSYSIANLKSFINFHINPSFDNL